MEVKSKIGVAKKRFSQVISGQTVIFEKGEMVWLSDSDTLPIVAICKYDKPFVAHLTKDYMKEFFIEWQIQWQRIR